MLLYFRRRLRSQGRRWNSCRSRGRSCVTRTKSCRCCWRTCGQAGTVSCRSPTRSGPAFGNLLSGKAEQQCCCRSDRPASPNTWAGKKPLSFADLCFSASWHAVRKITRPGLEHLPGNAGQTALCEMPGPTGGPIGPDLQTVVDAWPHLSEATRAKILREVQRATR